MADTDWKVNDEWRERYNKHLSPDCCSTFQERKLNGHGLIAYNFNDGFKWSAVEYKTHKSKGGDAATLEKAKAYAENWAMRNNDE